jgi:hypothetical protein
MHGRPTAEELVDAVRALLQDQLAGPAAAGPASGLAASGLAASGSGPGSGSGPLEALGRHQIRIAVHALEIVGRELALGPAQEEAHRARLRALGFEDDASLAAAIRSGRLGDGPALRAVLLEDTRDRLLVANPRWLPAEGE